MGSRKPAPPPLSTVAIKHAQASRDRKPPPTVEIPKPDSTDRVEVESASGGSDGFAYMPAGRTRSEFDDDLHDGSLSEHGFHKVGYADDLGPEPPTTGYDERVSEAYVMPDGNVQGGSVPVARPLSGNANVMGQMEALKHLVERYSGLVGDHGNHVQALERQITLERREQAQNEAAILRSFRELRERLEVVETQVNSRTPSLELERRLLLAEGLLEDVQSGDPVVSEQIGDIERDLMGPSGRVSNVEYAIEQ
mmetsp:Transcript_14468/g.20834  ORF Transcript_14468/g.20834 Transcript_14468/m.20834 type:complete len:252 (+) Transcript_14468:1336-2091(+)